MQAEQRRRAILAEIAAIGPVLPGSIVERSTRCQRSGCHCRSEPAQLHGPYATWMHQQDGRQVTRTLTTEQAARLRPLIAANRRLKVLVKELEQLSLQLIEDTEGVSLGRAKPVGKRPAKAGK